jgi:hypothetical protein
VTALSERAARGERDAIADAKSGSADDVMDPRAVIESPSAEWRAREIAAHCLAYIADPSAGHALVPALLDDHFQVRAAAMSGLKERIEPSLQLALFDAFDRSAIPAVRHRVALMLGRIDPAVLYVDALAQRWALETSPVAREGEMVALAKAGHDEAKRAFVQALLAAERPEDLARFMNEHCVYIHAPWLLPALGALLDRTTPVEFLANDDPNQPPPYILRACDVAVNLIAAIAGGPFPFVAPLKEYTEHEIDEVRRWLSDLRRAP